MDLAHFWNTSGAYQINQSLRFNSADSTYLYRTFGSGDRNNWTLSVWVKRAGDLAAADCDIFYGYDGSSSALGLIEFNSGPVNHDQGGTGNGRAETSATLRDPSAWYHIVVSVDYGNATAANRVRIFVNGVQQTLGVNTVTTNDGQINGAWQHRIGARSSSTFNGYMAEMHFIGGTTVTTASDFGETDTITGAWIPKKYSGSYGTNGFYLKFDPSATNGIGHDHSGNGNNWTASGFSTSGTGTDVMSDTPTNNWCTLNPLDKYNNAAVVAQNGNLDFNQSGAAWWAMRASFGITSGKWYWEVKNISGLYQAPGLGNAAADLNGYFDEPNVWLYVNTGQLTVNGTTYSAGSWGGNSHTTNDIVGVAFDADNGRLWFSKNGTWQGDASPDPATATDPAVTGLTSGPYFPYFVQYQTTTEVNFGQRAFAYTPPTGFKALNTANLPEPTIKKGSKYFNSVLWTGNGTSQSITGVGFQPDLLWSKARNQAYSHRLHDAVRGREQSLLSNSTGAEFTQANSITSFDTDGFTVGSDGSHNGSGVTYVGWSWDANGAGSSNTAGTITSTVSANASAGFSIVTYTGTNTSGQSVGHGLGVVPAMVITKRRNGTGEWMVKHQSLATNLNLILNQTSATYNTTVGGGGGIADLTSSTTFSFVTGSVDTSNANPAGTMVAYCFSEVAGYSKFGSYTGNGSTDGVFVHLGFRPALLIVKQTNTTQDWIIQDSRRGAYNPDLGWLYPNLSYFEETGSSRYCDFLSNGFKIRNSGTGMNSSGGTYIFAAWAELPFKYANAR